MHKYADEILSEIDKAEGDKKTELLKKYGAAVPFNMLLSLNFNSNIKLDVPDGQPPYNVRLDEHPDTFQTTLAQQIKRLMNIVHGRNNLPKTKREHIFIQVLEGIPPKEAEVLIFAKDGALTELYPTITKEFVATVFPHYCV
jgi:hypothetical protein